MEYCHLIAFTGFLTVHLNPTRITKQQLLNKRRERFKNELKPHVDQFGRDMMNAFYKYWSEPNKSETKMRWELEKTWSLELRLSRWNANQKFEKSSFPTGYDANFDKGLDEGTRQEYYRYLRTKGWQYVMGNGVYGAHWKKITT